MKKHSELLMHLSMISDNELLILKASKLPYDSLELKSIVGQIIGKKYQSPPSNSPLSFYLGLDKKIDLKWVEKVTIVENSLFSKMNFYFNLKLISTKNIDFFNLLSKYRKIRSEI